MMKTYLILLLLCFSFIIRGLQAQDSLLSLQKALEIGLKNNYSIQIFRTNADIARNNNTLGNAGFLPNVGVTASYTGSQTNTDQKYTDNTPEIKQNNFNSNTTNAGVSLGWTLFDGMKMFATQQKLQELQDMGDLSVKIELENTISKLIIAYSNVVSQKLLFKEIQAMIRISEERMKIAQRKFNVGSSSKQEYLQAKVDLNAEQSALVTQKNLVTQSMIGLNELLALDPEKSWLTEDTLIISYKPVYADLKKTITEKNTAIQMAQKNLLVSDLSLKEINAQKFPKLSFSSGYSYNRIDNQTVQIGLNQSAGFSYGLNLTIPLYYGHNLSNQVKNARLNVLSYELQKNDIILQVQSDLLDAFDTFNNDLELLKLEQQNILNARENLNVALESYRLGSTSSIDLMNAQKSYSDAASRLIGSLFVAKAAEVGLMKLNGELVK